MATLKKMTRMGADVRQIARLLQAKAPEGHMLAYITPEEAELLKSQGGSGKPHADTGVPSFEVGETGMGGDYSYTGEPASVEPVSVSSMPPVASVEKPAFSAAQPAASFDASQFSPQTSAAPAPTVAQTPPYSGDMSQYAGAFPVGSFERAPGPTGQTYQIDTTPEKGIMQRLTEATGMKEDTLARLGLGGLQAVLGARTANKAAQQGKAGKAEMQAMAQPYQTKGAELQRAAQAGELTPQSQQALQAVQAQTAQQATARGGVGTMQSQAQVEAFRQQLLAQQYDYGLKLSGIGDNIALGAIKTGLQADQSVNELTSSYYNNIARSLLPQPAQQVVPRG
jgi:hypothetical protein